MRQRHSLPLSKQAGRLARAAWKVPLRWSWKHGSQERLGGFQRQNVNSLLVLRHAVCNRRWHEPWMTAGALRSSRRQASSHQRLTSAFWALVYWGAQGARLPQPSAPAGPTAAVQARAELPVRRLGTGYSWHQPFLRRPPSSLWGREWRVQTKTLLAKGLRSKSGKA